MKMTEVIVSPGATHVRSWSISPTRNHELLKEVVRLRHEFSKQECEHQHYLSGLKFRLEKEIHHVLSTADAERAQHEFEIRGLEDELIARDRIRKNEEERIHVRSNCYEHELSNLENNLAKNEELIMISREQMDQELNTRKHDGYRIADDIKCMYEDKLTRLKTEKESDNNDLRQKIADKDKELDEYQNKHIPDVKRQGDGNVLDMKAKIRDLKSQLEGLNIEFKETVEKTKAQNDDNHKIYDQNALINRLKVKVEKKATKTGTANRANVEKICSLEKLAFGYQKSFTGKDVKNRLGRQKSQEPIRKSKSLIKNKSNLLKDKEKSYQPGTNKLINKQKSKKNNLKKHKSTSKIRNKSLDGARVEKRGQDMTKTKSTGKENWGKRQKSKNGKKGNKRGSVKRLT